MKIRLISILSILAGIYHLYVAAFGTNSTMSLRVTHWIFISALSFLVYPLIKRSERYWYLDLLAAALAVSPGVYFLATWSDNVMSVGLPTFTETFFGALLILTVLEAARRAAGWGITIIAAAFLLYAMYGHLIPGALGHREYSLSRIVSYMYMTSDGIYGVALGVSAQYIVLFILFGAFLNLSGAGKLFIDMALGLTGRKPGGPAKAAIVSSAIMGTISGSPVANVVTTGTYTIPLMKKAGYKPHEAGAIEAVASTGGMIMPPIMGAAAFIMADYLQVPYSRIVFAAIIPALLYYLSLYFVAQVRALKNQVGLIRAEELPDAKGALQKNGMLFIPLILLIVFLVIGWSPTKAALYSILAMWIIILFKPNRAEIIKGIPQAIIGGIRDAIPVSVATAVAGIVVGVVNMTGLGVKFSSFMITVSNGNSFILLISIMLASLILGMGLPATAVYILLATLSAPALVEVGFSPLAAHMFVFYFGIISAITPPVALSAFAASGIAKSNPNKTGFYAFRFGFVAYVVPFIFTYHPAMLMEGSFLEIVQVAITSGLGVVLLVFVTEKFAGRPLALVEQGFALAGSVCLFIPEWKTDVIGLILLFVYVFMYFMGNKRSKPFGMEKSEREV